MKLMDILKEVVNLYPGKMGADVNLTKKDYKKYKTVDIDIKKLVRNEPLAKMKTGEGKKNIMNLMAIIKTGQKMDPIEVMQIGEDKYKILNGHHRFTAYQRLGINKIPSVIIPAKDIVMVDKKGKPI
jgi:ParB-like chromosome segregation protein Spo0J